jgi:hypothetical protein
MQCCWSKPRLTNGAYTKTTYSDDKKDSVPQCFSIVIVFHCSTYKNFIKFIPYHSPAGDKSDLYDKFVLGTIL